MEPHSTPPGWLEILGWIALVLAFASAAFILYDIYPARHRQQMRIMEVVYPVTALYFGPFAVWFYLRYGRQQTVDRSGAHDHQHHHQHGGQQDTGQHAASIRWNQTAEGVTHCGAGCTIGDIVGEWFVFAAGIMIAGHAIYADFVADFVLAWLLGVVFQYFTIAPMRGLKGWAGIKEAIKADTLSIISFQIGLFVGMWLYQMVIFSEPLPKTSASYWFLMQLSMVLGFFTAYPVNRWLLAKGIKQPM